MKVRKKLGAGIIMSQGLWRTEKHNALLMFAGSLMLALGVTLFLQPNQVASGGTPGIAILIHYLSGLPLGIAMLAVNLPLLLAGRHYLGTGFVWRTVVAVALISALVDLANTIFNGVSLTTNPLLAALYGGAAIGIGVGLVLKGNASAGGPTIVARIVAMRTRISTGRVILVIDGLIVVCSALVFGAIEPAIWSLVSIVVTGRCIDLVLSDYGLKKWRLNSLPGRSGRQVA